MHDKPLDFFFIVAVAASFGHQFIQKAKTPTKSMRLDRALAVFSYFSSIFFFSYFIRALSLSVSIESMWTIAHGTHGENNVLKWVKNRRKENEAAKA